MIQDTLRVVYRILCIQLGTPPAKFDWSYRTKLSADDKAKSKKSKTASAAIETSAASTDSPASPADSKGASVAAAADSKSPSSAAAVTAETPSSKSKEKEKAPSDPFKAKTQFVKHTNLTPLSFYQQFVVPNTASAPEDGSAGVGGGVEGAVSLVHDPRNPYYKLYTVQYLGNVVGGSHPVRYVNVPIDVLKQHARNKLVKERLPCWFGCDVGR